MRRTRGKARVLASVTIMGAGIFGLSCAWEMARRGARVHVIEARRIGAGSSGGHVGALAPHAPENWNRKKQFQLDSLLMADDFWRAVETASGRCAGFARTGRVQPLAEGAAELLEARLDASAIRWPAAMAMRITQAPATSLIPDSPSGLWLEDGLSARLNPRAALQALAHAIRASGGRISEGTSVRPQTGPILWATGAEGLAHLSQALDRPVGKGVKGQSVLLGHAAPEAAQIFADGLHVVPQADGTTAVGSTTENDFTHPDPDDRCDGLVVRARAICPGLRDAPILECWAGIRPRAGSRAPLLGAWPGRSGHYVANGGFKIGFGMAPMIARVMARLILDGRDEVPPDFRLI
ncbi:MAG: NAD(P)/FAD-dependent oxidoreductase [Paracoccus sp. (in: a-proteobacteria)]|uniref:NAD(P)/FAD-dependent oxidoreductase n=1 Tax=unclassified Paracoccus (in: a-proteobacteria) TaxID=2688777 RepID=UPI000C35B988|nr:MULTISPECIES: FAD-dependent oxidoreductase [unclassified Paracoccus (in: a-proteobacteria)]MAN55984.1 FAD-dependent oxidoreductase [Paracoccus sp. (in: a-proteobacteria)]MBA47694.1 FAD-dependent oxidoreductase [Paracoccus sp. (in: a-proteobacteria)]MCS5601637.1 FAD-binding oxidoreductase [Paracoccus sp. (in: a-proteobacteria)]